MLEILRPGVQTTVQDLGRHGLRHLGIAQNGALDTSALLLGNRLLGNAANLAALEIALGPVAIRFGRDGWFALTGADFAATLDDEPAWCGWRLPCRAGQILRLAGGHHGMRAYLCVDGGIDVPLVLGARATDLKAAYGGHHGRALQAGDRLPQGAARSLPRRLGVYQRPWQPLLRAIPGPEYHEFDAASRHAFWQHPWTVSPHSNRMGYRLQGTALQRNHGGELLSHAVLPGVVQVPPNGQPIVLLADAQTTGGYPRIASVIDADLWLLAQARPGSRLHFVECDLATARAAREHWLRDWRRFELAAWGSGQLPSL
ncbi:biotin-dependent carboxyltransferase family protein [Vogesella sp. LIG4]|uniref:5-oxoprolinase subunit C family protein n=1 Tax=Vogesella sp. LIG4 TaxID=1192162 RepID=UPI00081FF89F|nr:biotin-dependent carboxyltransferase family protein [Vogesella sp. LIG4]SCK11899.1 biotin-dependent carboxylase uncharacterized domain-containing protein [Vogesella sp. LIG4]